MEGIRIEVIQREPEIVDNVPCSWGMIQINKFSERFTMPLTWWSCEYYEKQWKEGFKRLETHDISCLVTCAQLPLEASFVNRWILYKENDTVYVQNHILFGKEFREKYMNTPFNLKTCYEFIAPRKDDDEEEDEHHKVSEWSFPVSSLNSSNNIYQKQQ